ncbi:MAG TPA: GFA family protein [Terriglobia bacterium]|nr:GFA family protein [Terriglobia bacterium]
MTIYSGGCLCGQARFTASGEASRIGICHCFTCRKSGGSIFGAFAIYPTDAVAVSGLVSAVHSSASGRRFRCVSCGSPVYERDENSDEIELPLGAFDDIGIFIPTYESWTIRREHWLPALPSIRQSNETDRQA